MDKVKYKMYEKLIKEMPKISNIFYRLKSVQKGHMRLRE